MIDPKKLQDLGYPVFRTTKLKQQFQVHGHVDYVTESHILVSPLIPHSCILGFMSKSEFTTLCLEKGILTSSMQDRYVGDCKKPNFRFDFSVF